MEGDRTRKEERVRKGKGKERETEGKVYVIFIPLHMFHNSILLLNMHSNYKFMERKGKE